MRVNTQQAIDEQFMREALALAAQARGRTSPNPMVPLMIRRTQKSRDRLPHIIEGFPRATARPHTGVKSPGARSTIPVMEAASPMRELAPGTMLDDKYRVDRLLAVGGMGAVYEGTHVKLRKRVGDYLEYRPPFFRLDCPAIAPSPIKRFEAATAVVGDKLYVFARQGGSEVLQCLNAADGKEVWSDKYEVRGADGPASSFAGPRASPTVADGKVVVLGVRGAFYW